MGSSDLLCISGNILIVPRAIWEGDCRNQEDWKSLAGARRRAEKTGGGGRLREGGKPIEGLQKSWGHREGFALPQAVELSDSKQFHVGPVFDPVIKVTMQTKERCLQI